MTIDEAIKKYNKLANNEQTCYPEEAQQLAEWLEELKNYRAKNKMVVRVDVENMNSIKDKIDELSKYAESQYNKAIDDFVANVKDALITDCSVFNTDDIRIFIDIIEELAEQLKAGGENE